MFTTAILSIVLLSAELISEVRAPIVYEEVFAPPGDDKPADTQAGGSRTDLACNSDEPTVQALLPVSQYGLTQKNHPDIFIQLAGTSATAAVLVFENSQTGYYERAVMPIPEGVSLVNWSLLDSAPPLTVGKNYRWSVSLICNDFLRPNDPVLSGWVQRTEANHSAQEPDVEAVGQTLASQGYWYDLLSWLYQQENAQLEEFWQQYQQSTVE